MGYGEGNEHVERLVLAYENFAEAGGTLEELHDKLAFYVWGDDELLEKFLANERAKRGTRR